MAGEPKGSSKRKRYDSGRSDSGGPAKRASKASGSETDAQQHARKLIKAVYRRYNLLSDPASEGRDSAFQGLLEACEGDPAVRRLAARLIPRFAADFPDKLDAAARSLMDVSSWDGGNLQPSNQRVAEATRLDALRGLGQICIVAASQSEHSRTASSIILHLFRRWQLCKSRHKGRSQPWPDGSGPANELDCLQTALFSILSGAPRAMLSACLDFLGYGSGELFDAARDAVAAFLHREDGRGRNGTSVGHQPGESPLLKAVNGDSDLADWLTTMALNRSGKKQPPEISTLLAELSSASGTHRTEVPPASEETLQASAGPPAERAVAGTGSRVEPGAPAKRPSLGPGEDAQLLVPKSPVAEAAAAAGGQPASAVPGRVASAEVTARRVESGELQGESAGRNIGDAFLADERPPISSLPCPGGSCAIILACLWINGIAVGIVDEPRLRRECEDFAPVKRVILLRALHLRGQALVFFHEMSHAVACYEGLNGEVKLARKPLQVEFCEDAPSIAAGPNCPPRLHVWVSSYTASDARLEAALQDAASDGVSQPKRVQRVGGAVPGVILEFESAGAAAAALKVFRARRRQSPQARSRPSPPRRRPSPFRGRSPPLQQRPIPGDRSPGALRRANLPEFATSTLWVGQVGPDVDERELIAAFERHGRLVGFKLLRKSHCGFIDFDRVESAAAAREALHNATFGSCEIRVEFKEEGRALGRVPSFGGRGGARFGRGRGRGRFDGFHSRHGFMDGSPLGYRGRGSPVPMSPPRGRSRSPHRRSWSPQRSPVRGRRGVPLHRFEASPGRRQASPGQQGGRQQSDSDDGRNAAVGKRPRLDRRRAARTWDAPGPPGAADQEAASAPASPSRSLSRRSGRPVTSSTGLDGAAALSPALKRSYSPAASEGQPQRPLRQPSPTSAEQPEPQSSREGVAQATPSWSGALAKSGAPICALHCLEGPRRLAGGANGLEPCGWPPTLNVTLRSDIGGVLRNLGSLASQVVAVRRLVLAPESRSDEEQTRFKNFCTYLTERNRAGVVENVPPTAGLLKRMIYLIPASEAVAKGLSVTWTPHDFMILALIVPSAG